METQFGLVAPWQADRAPGTLAVQVIVLVQSPGPVEVASLRETLGSVAAAPVARRLLAAGGAGADLPSAGFDAMGLRVGAFGDRLAGALADAYAAAALPMLLIRSDILGVSPDMLEDAALALLSGEADAALGMASDGGFWLLGLRRPDRSLVIGIEPPGAGSGAGGGRLLLDRLASAGLRVALAPRLEAAAGGPGLPARPPGR